MDNLLYPGFGVGSFVMALIVVFPIAALAYYAAGRRGLDLPTFATILQRIMWTVYGLLALGLMIIFWSKPCP